MYLMKYIVNIEWIVDWYYPNVYIMKLIMWLSTWYTCWVYGCWYILDFEYVYSLHDTLQATIEFFILKQWFLTSFLYNSLHFGHIALWLGLFGRQMQKLCLFELHGTVVMFMGRNWSFFFDIIQKVRLTSCSLEFLMKIYHFGWLLLITKWRNYAQLIFRINIVDNLTLESQFVNIHKF